MAGGPFAEAIMCMPCAFEDHVVTRAVRTRDGVETDQYRCERGHEFGVEYRRGPATTPQWPPSESDLAAVEAMKRDG
jgi:lysyl-tRNA synthetase class I